MLSLVEECIGDELFLFHKLLAFLETVALAFDVDDSAMMQYSVQNGRCDSDVCKNLVPLGKGFVAGKDRGDLLIPSCNELKEQISPLNIHGQIADFVDDEQLIFAQCFELLN